MLPSVLTALVYVYIIGVAVVLVWEDRDPTTTLAWLLVLIFLPLVGIPLYVLFGRNWRGRRKTDRIAREVHASSRLVMTPVRVANEDACRERDPRMGGSDMGKVIHSVEEQCDASPLPADSVEIIGDGTRVFERLIEDIHHARASVHLQFYIWECDELTARVVDALEGRLADGVEVRLSYDLVGSIRYGKQQLRELAAAGARVEADKTHPGKLNYRNHRKIVVIDGEIGYTGGFNVGQEYIDGGDRYPSWRDTHLRITGPFVSELQHLFAAGWYESTGESLFCERYFPVMTARDPASAIWLQVEHSSADSEWEAIRETFMLAITNANERVWISSPYFVPEQGLYDALIATALSGVDVRLIMTGWPDKRIAYWAAMSYYERFLRAGGRMYQYTAGFYHPKTMSLDGAYCSIGTTNFDTRSLQLHSEMTVWVFDRELTARQDALFERDLELSREVTLADVHAYSSVKRFRNSLMRLGAKML